MVQSGIDLDLSGEDLTLIATWKPKKLTLCTPEIARRRGIPSNKIVFLEPPPPVGGPGGVIRLFPQTPLSRRICSSHLIGYRRDGHWLQGGGEWNGDGALMSWPPMQNEPTNPSILLDNWNHAPQAWLRLPRNHQGRAYCTWRLAAKAGIMHDNHQHTLPAKHQLPRYSRCAQDEPSFGNHECTHG
ncbi:hypothetical protein N658DRAFT_127407 [Parathielavia hyrcaniae]|uniref:Uncharacterized protein n=1 Tax=Parathielavia hyrcaniae TaxID=113614 RepID=A0AAN6T6B1_9PEZI|nr:hypothetical protein N658DRAFT_127407 [Parathielavia hyrcaniae]